MYLCYSKAWQWTQTSYHGQWGQRRAPQTRGPPAQCWGWASSSSHCCLSLHLSSWRTSSRCATSSLQYTVSLDVETRGTSIMELTHKWDQASIQGCQSCPQILSDWPPNGTNLGLFKISFSTCWPSDPKICPIWSQSGPKSDIPWPGLRLIPNVNLQEINKSNTFED